MSHSNQAHSTTQCLARSTAESTKYLWPRYLQDKYETQWSTYKTVRERRFAMAIGAIT